MELKGKKIAILGVGQVGLSLIRAAVKAGSRVTAYGNENPLINAKVSRELEVLGCGFSSEPVAKEALLGFDLVVLAPSGGMYLEAFDHAKERGVLCMNDLDFIFPYLKGKIIAVTGTCGKSTTVDLIHKMLKRQGLQVFRLGGEELDWGKPIHDRKSYDFTLLELGSTRLERTERLRPHIAVLLNIFPAHGERHEGSLLKYFEAKTKIYLRQEPTDFLVFHADAPNLQEAIKVYPAKSRLVRFSLSERVETPGVHAEKSDLVWGGSDSKEERYSLEKSKINGFPTRMLNAMAAIAVAKLCGVEADPIQEAISRFKPLPGRMTRVRKLDGVVFVDDSHANNIGATIWTLNSFSKPIIWVAGGESVWGSRLNTLPRYIRGKVKRCVVIGTLAEEMAGLFKGSLEVIAAGDLTKAVEIANQIAEPGDMVVFSPACPPDSVNVSAGLLRSEVYRNAVKSLPRTPRMMQRYQGFRRI